MNVVAMVLRAVQIARGYGLTVTFEPGWERRGNGYSGNYVGFLVHHTATPSSLANPFPTRRLLRDGRFDLSGPLCNSAGPADGSIHIMAAHAANHAGASGGRSMGPLPTTSLFNPRVWGHEIDYAGNVPMLTSQYRAAGLWAIALLTALKEHGQIATVDRERIRAHAETSITGKWDAGDAPGRTINMSAFRTAAGVITQKGGFLMALTDKQQADLYHRVMNHMSPYRNLPDGTLARVLDQADGGFIVGKLNQMAAQITAMQGSMSDSDARILAAIVAADDPTGQVDVSELAAALTDKLAPAIRAELGRALLEGNFA